MRKFPLKVGARYRVTHGGAAYPHLVNEKVRVLTSGAVEVLTGSSRGLHIPEFGLSLRSDPERQLCKGCAAYSYPHRKGGGRCLANDPGPFCGSCGMPCDIVDVEVDEPYHGRTLMSRCCGDKVYHDSTLKNQFTTRELE